MAKIVKFCEACEEGFAEKFAFCPNCGGNLSAFEMSPVTEPKVFDVAEGVTAKSASEIVEIKADPPMPEIISAAKPEPPVIEAAPVYVEPVKEVATTAALNMSAENFNSRQKVTFHNSDEADDGYMPTFVEETQFARSARQMLLLGAFVVVMSVAFGAIIFSLFNTKALVASLDEEELVAFVPEVEAESIEPEVEKKKKDDGGGGGGGGNKEETPTSKGVLATQVEKPLIAPSRTMDRVTNPEIPIQMATQGTRQEKPSDEKYGNPNSTYTIGSDGTGSGGGQGEGRGRGQGNGQGTGAGNGIGSGNGDGNGNGNGNGDGDGDGANTPPSRRPPAPAVTEALRIIAKPRPGYTDEARQNAITGVVRLRVTFLASGQIGGISPVSGLPNGLTEKAIAAARQIQFEPMKKNGVPQSVSKVIEYNFTIY